MSINITKTGVEISSAENVLQEVFQDWRNALGNELNTATETPQGQLIASEAAIIAAKDALFLEFCNQINPHIADGAMQDAVAAIYFLTRTPATRTYVELECTGRTGVTIPVGALAKSQNGDLFVCTEERPMTNGKVTLIFESVDSGPVPADAGTIDKIQQPMPGWDSCINPKGGEIGRDVESRSDFEARRRESVAKNATGSVSAIYANVASVEGVTDCRVYENVTSQIKYINSGSVPLRPHSVFVCAAGGDNMKIAEEIFKRKSAGCDTSHNEDSTGTEMKIIDPVTGAEYEIRFQRPAVLLLRVQVTALKSTAPAGAETIIRDAVYNNFIGADGFERVRIGNTVYASRFYSPLAVAGINTISVKIASGSGPLVDLAGSEINQILTLSKSNIEVILQ